MRTCKRRIDAQTFARLAPEENILPYAQTSDEFEMLVNQTDGPGGAYSSGVGAQRTERDIGKRRFSGAVLADECADLSRKKIEVDAVNGDDPRKSLINAAERERGVRR